MLKFLLYLAITIFTWRSLFFDEEVRSLLFEVLKIFSTFKTYLSLRQYTIKVKKNFDKYFFIKLCILRFVMNFLVEYFYRNVKQFDKLIYFERYTLICFLLVFLLNKFQEKNQRFFSICSDLNKSIYFYEHLHFELIDGDFMNYGHFFIQNFYGNFKNRHFFWIHEFVTQGVIYVPKLIKFYSSLMFLNVFVFYIRMYKIEFITNFKLDGLLIASTLLFMQFFFKNDRFVSIWKHGEIVEHTETLEQKKIK